VPEHARLIRTAREVNDHKPEWVLNQVKAAIADALAAKPEHAMREVKVACLGLTFKPDIDDLRESPALTICVQIAKLGCQVLAVEPHIDTLPAALATAHVGLSQLEDALESADVVCVLVKHRPFVEAADALRSRENVIDAVGIL